MCYHNFLFKSLRRALLVTEGDEYGRKKMLEVFPKEGRQ